MTHAIEPFTGPSREWDAFAQFAPTWTPFHLWGWKSVIERVIGDLAVLSEGPPVKTAVVTVGAALLYGAEVFGK